MADWPRGDSAWRECLSNVPRPKELPEKEPLEFDFVRAVGGGRARGDDLPAKARGADGRHPVDSK